MSVKSSPPVSLRLRPGSSGCDREGVTGLDFVWKSAGKREVHDQSPPFYQLENRTGMQMKFVSKHGELKFAVTSAFGVRAYRCDFSVAIQL